MLTTQKEPIYKSESQEENKRQPHFFEKIRGAALH
jgi:hypothetical protein